MKPGTKAQGVDLEADKEESFWPLGGAEEEAGEEEVRQRRLPGQGARFCPAVVELEKNEEAEPQEEGRGVIHQGQSEGVQEEGG